MNDIIKQQIQKSLQELNAPQRPKARSRIWKDPKGYRYLVQWSNAVLLRYLVRIFTSSKLAREYKKKAQLEDAARSTVRNIEEGYKRSTTSEYLEFIGFSQGSLEEVKGDMRDMVEDGFLSSKPGSSLESIGINLADFNKALRPKSYSPITSSNNPVKDFKGQLKETKIEKAQSNPAFSFIPLNVLYPPLKNVKLNNLSYEIFIELINKTDYLLRKLVESLEKKQSNERRFYQVEQARIKSKFTKR